jgi:hypothetical protein
MAVWTQCRIQRWKHKRPNSVLMRYTKVRQIATFSYLVNIYMHDYAYADWLQRWRLELADNQTHQRGEPKSRAVLNRLARSCYQRYLVFSNRLVMSNKQHCTAIRALSSSAAVHEPSVRTTICMERLDLRFTMTFPHSVDHGIYP